MYAIGRTSINSIRIHEVERNIDSLSKGTISPATGVVAIFPHGEGPDLKVKACVRLDFNYINYYKIVFDIILNIFSTRNMCVSLGEHTHTHKKIISNNDDDKITKRIREDLNKKRSWFSLYVFS
jgi:hypothetical protein